MIKRDNLHFSFRTVDGYNKPFNAIISEREAGKTTAAWLDKVYKAFLEGRTSIILKRRIVDITQVYLDDIGEIINKFSEKPVTLKYNKGSIKDGVVDIYIDDKRFVRVAALSCTMSKLKSLMLRDLKYIIFDEFICNTKMGEKYLSDEAFKFREIYNTFQRENFECEYNDLKVYFLGNPYSVYNPYFSWWNVNYSKLSPGEILSGDTWVVQCYQIKPELKDLILSRNPLYKFDDSYTKYAFGGIAINDANIRIKEKQPEGYKLHFLLKVDEKYISIYKNTTYENWEAGNVYWCCECKDVIGSKRTVFCFDLMELVSGSKLYCREDSIKFSSFKACVGNRYVEYSNVEIAYLIQDLYLKL